MCFSNRGHEAMGSSEVPVESGQVAEQNQERAFRGRTQMRGLQLDRCVAPAANVSHYTLVSYSFFILSVERVYLKVSIQGDTEVSRPGSGKGQVASLPVTADIVGCLDPNPDVHLCDA